jgi:hypothetical protein
MNEQLTTIETPFTPGPYMIQRDQDGCDDYFHIVDQTHHAILASIQFWDDAAADAERAWANARLFAKAPEMLQVLKELIHFVGHETRTDLPVEFYAVEYQANLLIAEVEGTE